MRKNWTFGQKLGIGYAAMVAITLIVSAVAVLALGSAVENKDRVIDVDAKILLEAQALFTADMRLSSDTRGYLLSREARFLDRVHVSRDKFNATLARVSTMVYTDEGRRVAGLIGQAAASYVAESDRVFELARHGASFATLGDAFEDRLSPARDRIDQQVGALVDHQQLLLDEAQRAANEAAARAQRAEMILALVAVALAVGIAFVLARMLNGEIGGAVSHVQSASTQLQSASTQQAIRAGHQADAMSEIITTVTELVATSNQIAESAQHVTRMAEQAAASARQGNGTVGGGQESIADLHRQVDQVVAHMLDLGKKSQQIGAVLDIVSELAEQTNILSINATIEASGAGESGHRFAVVADEIRKLADRVALSTKEIRGLIDDVRSAVNVTVMATESTAKSVESGARQFTEVAVAFKQIAGLVGTAAGAAKEIELSTKQQATAVEQVRSAVSAVTQGTREAEAHSAQTLQTVSQLAQLSRDLMRLIKSQRAAG